MSNHDGLVSEQWEKFLKHEKIKGGNLYYFRGGECVGNIKKTLDLGSRVRFFFNWSARRTLRGWVRRNFAHEDVSKHSLRNVEPGKPVELGGSAKLYWADAHDLSENQLIAPTSRNSPKEPKKPKPAPLLDGL